MTDINAPRFRLGFLTHVQGRDTPAAVYRNAAELFVAADELGFDVGWVAQHHAPLGGHGGLPSPWTFLANVAARTTRIRLATAITILPLEDPLRLAEDLAGPHHAVQPRDHRPRQRPAGPGAHRHRDRAGAGLEARQGDRPLTDGDATVSDDLAVASAARRML